MTLQEIKIANWVWWIIAIAYVLEYGVITSLVIAGIIPRISELYGENYLLYLSIGFSLVALWSLSMIVFANNIELIIRTNFIKAEVEV